MTQKVAVTQPRSIHIARYGITLAVLGALLISIDGIVAMARNSLLIPTVGMLGLGVFIVAATEAILGVLALASLYMSKDTPNVVAYLVGTLAVLSFAFGGGFYFIGAIAGLVGALSIHYNR
jgi:hypothetical protein